jgi:hypothetical protein
MNIQIDGSLKPLTKIMKLSQIAYTHVLELLETWPKHIFLEMLNFGQKFESEHSIRPFSQTNQSSGMKLSQFSQQDLFNAIC